MTNRSTVSEALWFPASSEAAGRVPDVAREHPFSKRASYTYPPKKRARHVILQRVHTHSNLNRIFWFGGLYLTSMALFGAFVSAERALLALL